MHINKLYKKKYNLNMLNVLVLMLYNIYYYTHTIYVKTKKLNIKFED